MKLFRDRIDAGNQLALKLSSYKNRKDTVILAIPRGALEIGAVLRKKLNIPLDIVVTKKIGAPGNEEFAIGAVGPDGEAELNEEVIRSYGISKEYIDDEISRLQHEIRRRYQEYRGDPSPPDVRGKTVIVVDDGIATGLTALEAVQYLRQQKPEKIILAVPVAASDSYEKLKNEVDEIVCLHVRDDFYAVGQFYSVFPQVDDEEAKRLLEDQ